MSYGVYTSQLMRFPKASSHGANLLINTRNTMLTQKLLKQGYHYHKLLEHGYRYHKLRKTFSKFYRRYYNLI